MKRVQDPSAFHHVRSAHVPPIPPYRVESNQFMGFPMCQSRLAVPSWSYFFEHAPVNRVIELGTNHGGFTVCLGIMGKEWDFSVTTFDIGPSPRDNTHLEEWFNFLGIAFYQMDVLAEPTFNMISEMIRAPGTTLLLCDGGNEIKEFNLYSQFLKSGDFISGHDFRCMDEGFVGDFWGWGEITAEEVQTAVIANHLEPFLYGPMAYGGWLCYRRK